MPNSSLSHTFKIGAFLLCVHYPLMVLFWLTRERRFFKIWNHETSCSPEVQFWEWQGCFSKQNSGQPRSSGCAVKGAWAAGRLRGLGTERRFLATLPGSRRPRRGAARPAAARAAQVFPRTSRTEDPAPSQEQSRARLELLRHYGRVCASVLSTDSLPNLLGLTASLLVALAFTYFLFPFLFLRARGSKCKSRPLLPGWRWRGWGGLESAHCACSAEHPRRSTGARELHESLWLLLWTVLTLHFAFTLNA